MKAFIVTALTIYIVGNFYVLFRLWQLLPRMPIVHVIFAIVAFVVVCALPLFFIYGAQMPVGVTSIIYKIGTSWLIFLLYLFLYFVLRDLIVLTHLVSKDFLVRYNINWVVLALFCVLMLSGYFQYNKKERVELNLTTDKSMGNHNSLRIVAISDLHLGYAIGKDELEKWIVLINKENPDLVIIAGDIIDNDVRPLNAVDMASCFKELKAPLGVYTCLGNHEYIGNVEASEKFIKDAGIQLLKDSSILIDNSFYLVGRDDRTNRRRKSLDNLTEGLDQSKEIILLDHQPYKLEAAENTGIDFQFSGHTHQGQVWPISLITNKLFEDSHGFLQKGKTAIYVSSGIGLWGGKFRIGTQSEYVVVTINKNKI